MRKVALLFIMFVFTAVIANAQTLTNKKGFTLLPEAGDIALGFDAVPFFDFMLNAADIMTNAGQTAQHPGYVSGFSQVIVGKYFLEDNLAIRAKIGINTEKDKDVVFFDDPKDVFANPTDPDAWAEISDVSIYKWSEWIIGGGLEFRRGHNRLQGFYGGELLFGFYNSSMKNEFAVVQDADAVTNGYTNGDGTLVGNPRVLSAKSGSEFWVGLRGFVGVEYFFAPKMSVAGEFGWGPAFYKYGRSKIEVESWDPVNSVSEIKETEGPYKGSMFGFMVDDGIGSYLSPSAALTLLFHF
jgi:hypothetical protein